MKLAILAALFLALSSCAYQSTVASRKIGVAGTYDKDTGAAGGELSDTVTYR